MTMTAPRILPPLTDDNREFWTSGARNELRIPWCEPCARFVFPTSLTCPSCGGATEYRTVSGQGTIYTFTVNRQPYHPDVEPPYVIAIVELDEQPDLRFTTNIVDCADDDLAIGLPVHVVFEQHGDVFVPLFAPGPS